MRTNDLIALVNQERLSLDELSALLTQAYAEAADAPEHSHGRLQALAVVRIIELRIAELKRARLRTKATLSASCYSPTKKML